MFRSRPKNSTGVHFGDDTLHLVELSEAAGEIALESVVSLELPSKIQRMTPADPRIAEAMVLLLRTARRDHGITFQNPYVALHSRSFLLKRRTLVKGGTNEGREQLEWEVGQFLTDEADSFAFDFLVAGGFGFVVAARQTAIDWMRLMCNDADIEKPGFDVAPFALFNALESSGTATTTAKQLLVDVDRLEARLVLMSSSALAGVETCRWDRSGPLATAETVSAIPGDARHQIDSSDQLDLLLQAMERLESNGGDGGVDRIWVSGDEAAMWCESIAQRTSVATAPLNPFVKLATGEDAPDDTSAAAYCTAAGLAFRGLSEA